MSSIAIVGAGAAGTMAAYRLRRDLPGADVTVFDREPTAGGRTRRIEFAGAPVEVGATVLPAASPHLKALLDLTRTKPAKSVPATDAKHESVGFWDGAAFAVTAKASPGLVNAGFVRHYGPTSGLRTVAALRQTASRWAKIYGLQKAGRLFLTPAALLDALGLADLTGMSFRHAMGRAGVKGGFVDEILAAITRHLYTQDARLNAFAGELGLAAAGLAGATPVALEGGNGTLFAQALAALGVELVAETRVTRIEAADPAYRPPAPAPPRRRGAREEAVAVPPPSGRIAVVTKDGERRDFDAVVLAAPLETADLKVSAARRLVRTPPRQFQEVHVTLVAGTPSAGYFGLAPGQAMPAHVFAASSPRTPFWSLGVAGRSPEFGCPIWKLLTASRPLSDASLRRLFDERHAVTRFVWKGAYPVLDPGTEGAPFVLAPGVYYANGLEAAASTAEVATVAGYNVAGLVARQL
ncbi:MAG: NAD(P)-binding protein [Propionibacteriaceae bacterium]|jgi:phytoene dehydrogenase-like protein|nr:NAD(P)-binding protein [Propionibacteriaceae bacterium]